ncbi:MAG: hypothetical protein ACOYXB_02555 [Bacteroidota bacterium]
MKNNAGYILEIIWFVLGGFVLFLGVENAISKGFAQSWQFFVLALLALLMYYNRRSRRLSKNK